MCARATNISVFADLVKKRVLFAAEGKDHSVWEQFIVALEKHNGHRHAVTQVSLDMSPAYQKGVKETCRHAQVVFDKFHVVLNANQAVDQVRRAEVRLGGAGVWQALHQSQWLWRKNPEHLTEKEAARMAGIEEKSLRTAKRIRCGWCCRTFTAVPRRAWPGTASACGVVGCGGWHAKCPKTCCAPW